MGHAARCRVSLSDSLNPKGDTGLQYSECRVLDTSFPELWLLTANCLLNTLIPMAEKGNLVYWGELDSCLCLSAFVVVVV